MIKSRCGWKIVKTKFFFSPSKYKSTRVVKKKGYCHQIIENMNSFTSVHISNKGNPFLKTLKKNQNTSKYMYFIILYILKKKKKTMSFLNWLFALWGEAQRHIETMISTYLQNWRADVGHFYTSFNGYFVTFIMQLINTNM